MAKQSTVAKAGVTRKQKGPKTVSSPRQIDAAYAAAVGETRTGKPLGTAPAPRKRNRKKAAATKPVELCPLLGLPAFAVSRPGLNMNELAVRVAMREGGVQNLTIAQVKEVLHTVLVELRDVIYSQPYGSGIVLATIDRVQPGKSEPSPAGRILQLHSPGERRPGHIGNTAPRPQPNTDPAADPTHPLHFMYAPEKGKPKANPPVLDEPDDEDEPDDGLLKEPNTLRHRPKG